MAPKHKGRFARSLRGVSEWLADPMHWGVLLTGLLVLALLVCCILYLPGYIAARDRGSPAFIWPLGAEPSPERLGDAALLKAKNDIRTALLQAVGGLFFGATALFAWRQVLLKSDEQITNRFNEAIGHIGDDTRTDVRLGGIHALERIAKDSERDRAAIVDILVAYIQARAPRQKIVDEVDFLERSVAAREEHFHSLRSRAPDVQAALNALRSPVLDTSDIAFLELRDVDFRYVQLQDASFLSHAVLLGANLSGAHLSGAQLAGAELAGSYFWQAELAGANLSDAYLHGADLSGADLSGADLSDAILFDAKLNGAKLNGAKLNGARATMKGDNATRWPSGFTREDARARGVIFVDEFREENRSIEGSQPSQPH